MDAGEAAAPVTALSRPDEHDGGVCDECIDSINNFSKSCPCGQICRIQPCPAECRDEDNKCNCLAAVCLRAPPHCNKDSDCGGDFRCIVGVCECSSTEDCEDPGYRCSNGLCAPILCQSSRDCCLSDNDRCLTCRADGRCGPPLVSGAEPELSCAQRAPEGGLAAFGAAALALAAAALRLRHRRR
jgi:hypothetical protein